MGYDIERFVGNVNEGLFCCICRDVLEDPMQAPCEHAFCTSCICGWLVHHNNCPEDRQLLDLSDLRPLYRYMKNDLNRLQLCCRNREHGCEMVCSLESINQHEHECEYSQVACSNAGCPVQVQRLNLDNHLATCEYRSRDCPNGCGYAILSIEDAQHNCVAELRTELKLLRSEMIYRMEEAKHEMESRLVSQRRHMVQKESFLQNEIEELKDVMMALMPIEGIGYGGQVTKLDDCVQPLGFGGSRSKCQMQSQMSRMMSDIHTLMANERQQRQKLEQAELEKRELLELMKGYLKTVDCLEMKARKQQTSDL